MTWFLARLGLLIHRKHKYGPGRYHFGDCPRCACRRALAGYSRWPMT